jgi:hypothetical protein
MKLTGPETPASSVVHLPAEHVTHHPGCTCHMQNYLAFMLQYNKQLLLLLQKLLKESLWLVFHWKTETQNSQSILHHYDIQNKTC